MVYTVTLNPALDFVYEIEEFQSGEINRAKREYMFPGGKGMNVSILLKELGADTKAMGFLSGATGKAYEELVKQYGIDCYFHYLKNGFTRANLKISSNLETEINGKGPSFSKVDIEALCEKVKMAVEGDYLVLSGNINSLDGKTYASMMKVLVDTRMKVLVDTTGAEFMNTLPYHPFLVKPNVKELGDVLNKELKSKEEILEAAKTIQSLGAENVLVSMGEEGAMLVTANHRFFCSDGLSGQVKNTVGAGDSMLAGFLYGWICSASYETAFQYALASGSATAFSFGVAEKAAIEKLLQEVTINQV